MAVMQVALAKLAAMEHAVMRHVTRRPLVLKLQALLNLVPDPDLEPELEPKMHLKRQPEL